MPVVSRRRLPKSEFISPLTPYFVSRSRPVTSCTDVIWLSYSARLAQMKVQDAQGITKSAKGLGRHGPV
jgi:hypothetical protein